MKGSLTQERLKELLDYNSDTGIFTWKESRGGVRAGTAAGCVCWGGSKYKKKTSGNNKYLSIMLCGSSYKAHRLAFLYVKGYVPVKVDHKDNNGLHNWIDNLRECDSFQNMYNRGKQRNNTSGYKGVSKFQGKWRTAITCSGERITKVGFETPELAHQWYCEMAHKLHGEFART